MTHLIPHLANSNSLEAHFSRWTHLDVLLNPDELQELFEKTSLPFLLTAHLFHSEESGCIELETLIDNYSNILKALQSKSELDYSLIRKTCHFFCAKNLEGVFRKKINDNLERIVYQEPLILVKPLSYAFSKVDHTFHVSALSPANLFWGLRFSFPALYQAPGSHEIVSLSPKNNANAMLFKGMRTYLRGASQKVNCEYFGQKIECPLKIGHEVLNWIHPYFESKEKGLRLFSRLAD